MWWNKKEVKSTKDTEVNDKEPETIVLYKRIEKLYNRLQEFDYNGVYDSNLGKRQFKIGKCTQGYYNVTFYDIENKIACETDLDLFGETKTVKCFFNRQIFNLKVYEYWVELNPFPISLTAHEIDLAILEFENYIETIYKEHKAKIKELEG